MAQREIFRSMPITSTLQTPAGLGIALAIFAAGLYCLYRYLLPKPLPGIAYNPEATTNLFGDATDMAREVSKTGEFSVWLARQVERMQSPVSQVFVQPFQKPWVLLSDFRESQDILFRRGHEFDKPRFFSDGMLALGEFHARQPTNAQFKARRHLKQDLMTPTFLNTYMGPFMHEHGVQDLLRLLSKKMDLAEGRPFSVLHDLDNFALDVMLHYAFGDNNTESAIAPQLDLIDKLDKSQLPAGDKDDPVAFPEAPLSPFLVALQQAPDVLEKTTVSWLPHLSHWWWSHQGWYKKIFSQKQEQMPPQIEKAIDNQQSGVVKSAVEHILKREEMTAEKQGRQPSFRSKTMVDEVSFCTQFSLCKGRASSSLYLDTFWLTNSIQQMFADIIAGHHTTGSTMCWSTKFLTGYPAVQSKLRSALYSAIPEAVAEKRSPTWDELRKAKIPYLEAIIEEQLRLTPFSMAREATRDTIVLGRVIPKGCQVMMVNGGPGYLAPSLPVDDKHRSQTSLAAKVPGHWDESQDLKIFDPERWLIYKDDGTVEFDAAAGPQLGFGGGIRQCWGRRMAHMEVRTIMALIVWHFELLDIPEELGGYAGYDGISRQPQRSFVRLAKSSAMA